MSCNFPKILALDFDGVLCDGLIEYLETSQRTYCQIWIRDNLEDLEKFRSSFYKLRPVIETGWEMPILLRALALGFSEEEILQDWSKISRKIIASENLNPQEVMHQLDSLRDNWIKSDLDGWLALHKFYPGVIERLKEILNSSTKVYIITTKEGRFVKKLLQDGGLNFPQKYLMGKEVNRPKYETLRLLLQENCQVPENLWFVEDRLEALQSVEQEPGLQGVGLYLADWGYNTEQMRASLKDTPNIHLLSLEKFTQDFSVWDYD
jgi:phosphoglycolate phosphatase-like HAD superfamily hydrolase